jgi:hypothetical protein
VEIVQSYQVCNPRTGGVESEGSGVQGQPGLPETLSQKKKKKKKSHLTFLNRLSFIRSKKIKFSHSAQSCRGRFRSLAPWVLPEPSGYWYWSCPELFFLGQTCGVGLHRGASLRSVQISPRYKPDPECQGWDRVMAGWWQGDDSRAMITGGKSYFGCFEHCHHHPCPCCILPHVCFTKGNSMVMKTLFLGFLNH